jgi:hypothetical protein
MYAASRKICATKLNEIAEQFPLRCAKCDYVILLLLNKIKTLNMNIFQS